MSYLKKKVEQIQPEKSKNHFKNGKLSEIEKWKSIRVNVCWCSIESLLHKIILLQLKMIT